MAKISSKILEVETFGLVDDPLGIEEREDAVAEAARLQQEAGDKALEATIKAGEQARADLAPFRQAGVDSIPLLQQAIDDPSGRVINNPFFQALAADQEQRTLNQRSSLGLAGSGGTNDAFARQQLLLGNQFAQQDIQNLTNVTKIGGNAAAQTGNAGQQTGSEVSNLLTQKGNVAAAGVVGEANVQSETTNDAVGAFGSIFGAFF